MRKTFRRIRLLTIVWCALTSTASGQVFQAFAGGAVTAFTNYPPVWLHQPTGCTEQIFQLQVSSSLQCSVTGSVFGHSPVDGSDANFDAGSYLTNTKGQLNASSNLLYGSASFSGKVAQHSGANVGGYAGAARRVLVSGPQNVASIFMSADFNIAVTPDPLNYMYIEGVGSLYFAPGGTSFSGPTSQLRRTTTGILTVAFNAPWTMANGGVFGYFLGSNAVISVTNENGQMQSTFGSVTTDLLSTRLVLLDSFGQDVTASHTLSEMESNTTVPEPGATALMGFGLCLLWARRRAFKQAK